MKFLISSCNPTVLLQFLKKTLYSLTLRQGVNWAAISSDKIVDSLGTINRGLKDRGGLYVLKHTDMPAVLVKTAFISDGEDAVKLRDNADEFACAIARGVTDYERSL